VLGKKKITKAEEAAEQDEPHLHLATPRGRGVDRSGAVGQICGCDDARRREGGVGPALVLQHCVQPHLHAEAARVVLRPELTHPGLVSLMGLPTPPTLTLCVAVFRALCLNPGTDAESSKRVPLKEKVTASAPYSMVLYMLGFRSDTVAVTLKEMVELDAGSAGASANRCSTASSAVALGGNTTPKASTRTVMRLGFFWIRTGEEKQGSRAGVHWWGGESVRIGRQRDSMAYQTVQILGRQNMSEAAYPLPP
jgi:hypothetical protein